MVLEDLDPISLNCKYKDISELLVLKFLERFYSKQNDVCQFITNIAIYIIGIVI